MRFFRIRIDRSQVDFLLSSTPLVALTALGQIVYIFTLPLVGHLFEVSDFGLFTIYMAVVNIAAPLINLKYDGSLFSSGSDDELAARLHLCLVTCLFTTLVGVFFAVTALIFARPMDAAFGLLIATLPIGAGLSGLWDVASAFAIRTGEIRRLGVARLLQPLVLAVSHVLLGVAAFGPSGLLAGSILSYCVYSGYIFSGPRLRLILRKSLEHSLSQAKSMSREQASFPKMLAPAQLLTLGVSNLPSAAIGMFFGPTIAGLYGLAYRIVVAPVQIVCMPIGNVLTSHICGPSPRMSVVYSAMAAALALVSLPLLLLALASPAVSDLLLPPKWIEISRYISILAIGASLQALALPFYDSYAALHRQAARLKLEVSRFVAVSLGLFVPVVLAATPTDAVALMVATNTLSYLVMFLDGLTAIRRRIRTHHHRGTAGVGSGPAAPKV